MTLTQQDNLLKFELAAGRGFSAKFSYTNDRGETADRIVKPETVNDEYVEGYTEDGYRRFRLDRINGKVIIR